MHYCMIKWRISQIPPCGSHGCRWEEREEELCAAEIRPNVPSTPDRRDERLRYSQKGQAHAGTCQGQDRLHARLGARPATQGRWPRRRSIGQPGSATALHCLEEAAIRAAPSSACPFARDRSQGSHQHDPKIEPERPMLGVVEVDPNHLIKGNLVPTFHLP